MAAVDQAIDRAQREIDLIWEYRNRLVAAVVIGEADIGDVAATLDYVSLSEAETFGPDLDEIKSMTESELELEEVSE